MKKERTGIRNEKIFCFNCGKSFDMQLPQPATFIAGVLKEFEKAHKNCPKTWTEPVADPSQKSEKECEHWWIESGEHGSSSKAMFTVLRSPYSPAMGMDRTSYPHDPDDFRRCYLLIKACPHFKRDLSLMKNQGPAWTALVENWDKLTEMLETAMAGKKGEAKEMYNLMKSLGC